MTRDVNIDNLHNEELSNLFLIFKQACPINYWFYLTITTLIH